MTTVDITESKVRKNHKKITKIMKWIVADPKICHGKPVFKGTRILVSDILELLASGMSIEEILKEYPSLNEEMIRNAFEVSYK